MLAEYAACHGIPMIPAADETLTTWPPRRASIIGGTRYSSTAIGPIRFTSITRCQVRCGIAGDRAPGRDAGDVHHHVHRAVLLGDLGGHRADGVVVGDVDRRGVRDLAAGRA